MTKKRKSSLAMFSEVLKGEDVKSELDEIYNAPTLSKNEKQEKKTQSTDNDVKTSENITPEHEKVKEAEPVKEVTPVPEPENVDTSKTDTPTPKGTGAVEENKTPVAEQEDEEEDEGLFTEQKQEEKPEKKTKKESQKHAEADKEFTTIRIDKKKALALLILAKSGEFPKVETQTEMIDYIIQYFCGKKKINEILRKGIQF